LTLVELLIAMTILAMVALAVISARYFIAKRSVIVNDKAYAAEKAIQMMEEIKSTAIGGTAILDSFDDGSSSYNPILTTDKSVTSPGDPLSGNRSLTSGSGWRFLRNISIQHMADDPTGRQVYIRVFRSADSNPSLPDVELADVGGIVRTLNAPTHPSQVFDVYFLDLANVQGWWAQVPTLQNTFRNTVIPAILQLNPGLVIRQHYITRTAFGRDSQYVPYINVAQSTAAAAMPFAYFYPGYVTDDNGSPNTIFGVSQGNPAVLGVDQVGTVNVDGSHVSSTPYALCDQYNHAVRYPDEVRLYNQAVAQAAASGQPVPEPSLRMLLEQMNSQPQNFTNALIVNLHGELLPMPAMRNYSDAAKDPSNLSGNGGPNIRVVAHPECIHYPTGTAMSLRVYAYYDGMDGTGGVTTPANYPATAVVPKITILLPNEGLVASGVSLTAIVGNNSVTYADFPEATSGVASMGMSWTAALTNPSGGPATQLCITLYNTPLRCPQGPVSTGLSTANWLYGLEYIPCAIKGNGNPFNSFDLSSSSPNAKNTARWVITFLGGLPANTDSNNPYTIETRIGTDLLSGTSADNPPILSRTYVWVGNGAPPPITEQYQFIGDPRHCPYMDVKNGSQNSDPVAIGPDGYNWYFTGITNGTNYNGFTQAVSGWGSQLNRVDVPRYFQVFRNAILSTQAIWSTMNGYSYFYYGLGGEFGGDTSPFQNGVSFVQSPWVAGSNTVKSVDEILTQGWASANIKNARILMNTTHLWYAKDWLGELYPDSQYANWAANGNMPLSGSATFYREVYTSANLTSAGWNGPTAAVGTSLDSVGCAAFFNGNATGSGNSFFGHDGSLNAPPPYPANESATIMQLGFNLQPMFTIPLASPLGCTRPWVIGLTGTTPSEWGINPYKAQRTTLTIPSITTGGTAVPRNFYQSEDTNNGSNWQGSAVVQQTLGAQNAYYVVSGLAIQASLGAQVLGEPAIMEMLRTYMDGGLYNGNSHIVQLPLVTLLHPANTDQLVNPASISVTWSSAWQRWGANPYTEEYAPITYTSDNAVTINYNLKYFKDGDTTWRFVQDDTAAVTGIYDPGHAVTGTSYGWDVSNSTQFSQGNYNLIVEAYRSNFPLHYSFHEQDGLFISR
jgi:hypothetical protein